MIERLGSCVDPTDEQLFCTSQQIHVLQILEAMEMDGTATPEMVLVALIHDLGKVLLTTDEDPANVVCMNEAVGDGVVEAGAGLEQAMLQWNHDEFTYERLRDHVPEDLKWLIRYHSIDVRAVSHLMNESDLGPNGAAAPPLHPLRPRHQVAVPPSLHYASPTTTTLWGSLPPPHPISELRTVARNESPDENSRDRCWRDRPRRRRPRRQCACLRAE